MPQHDQLPPNMRLDASDARFVDVVHTDMTPPREGASGSNAPAQGPLVQVASPLRPLVAAAGGHMGSALLLGHRDYFPNGGFNQPGW